MKQVGRRLMGIGALATLAGCGFQPVYMPTASGKAGPAQRELASVNVPIIPERPGQELRLALQERLANDSGTPPAYDLRVSYTVSGEGIGILSNNLATRTRLTGTATWSLIARDANHTVLTSGISRTLDGANIFDAQYFAADQEIEAEQRRMAEFLATQIATRLAIWFRQQAAKEAS